MATPGTWVGETFHLGLAPGIAATLLGGFVALVALGLLSTRWRLAAHAALLALTLGALFLPELRASAAVFVVVAWLRWDLR